MFRPDPKASFGAWGGGLFGGASAGLGSALHLSQNAAMAIFGAVGAGISFATGGWNGLVSFGAGFLGGLAGKGLVGAMQPNENYSSSSKSAQVKSNSTQSSDDIDKVVDIKNGTDTDIQNVKSDLNKIFSTPRGKDMLQAIQASGRKLIINLNDNLVLNGKVGGLELNIDPSFNPSIQTVQGEISASTTRILAHEMGHAIFGTLDAGAGQMLNVNLNENPVMNSLGEPSRTVY